MKSAFHTIGKAVHKMINGAVGRFVRLRTSGNNAWVGMEVKHISFLAAVLFGG